MTDSDLLRAVGEAHQAVADAEQGVTSAVARRAQLLRDACENGYTQCDIAEFLGVSQSRVSRMMKQ
ncbi:helix-turn-helix domain-containing protein [Auritidibacter sp. NML100628]|uniref:helix-turn-helix domain-containing protein n=1 Tax=Auritidibacter TaxID=1160973 RepID=UPI000D738D2F|nr:hypothetical protein DCC24_03360 [Auritidibacter sp. NML100628]